MMPVLAMIVFDQGKQTPRFKNIWGVSGGILYLFTMLSKWSELRPLLYSDWAGFAYIFSYHAAVIFGAAVFGYLVTLTLFGLGKFFGFLENKAGARDDD